MPQTLKPENPKPRNLPKLWGCLFCLVAFVWGGRGGGGSGGVFKPLSHPPTKEDSGFVGFAGLLGSFGFFSFGFFGFLGVLRVAHHFPQGVPLQEGANVPLDLGVGTSRGSGASGAAGLVLAAFAARV